MRKGVASRTAMWVAAMRGLAELDDPAIVHDPFAKSLLPQPYRSILGAAERAPGASRAVLRGLARLSRNLTRHLAFRTRAIDDVIADEARTGVDQLVLLGAGFDARAWRLEALAGATVFEVDYPATQESKRETIRGRPPIARAIAWAPIDFAKQSLDEVLERAGHDKARRTIFVWEGVTMYLDSDAIDATLSAIARRAAAGSTLLVTYHDDSIAPESVLLTVMVRAAGEPFRTRMTPTQMRERLARHAIDVERDEGSVDWSARYLGESGYRTGERLVVARKRLSPP